MEFNQHVAAKVMVTGIIVFVAVMNLAIRLENRGYEDVLNGLVSSRIIGRYFR